MYWLTGVIGALLMVSPYTFGYSDNNSALWTSLIIGGALVVVSALEGYVGHDRDVWEYWVIGLAGLGSIAAPFVFGFNELTEAVWASIAAGVVVVLAAGARLIAKPAS